MTSVCCILLHIEIAAKSGDFTEHPRYKQSFQPLEGRNLYKTKNPTGFKNLSGLKYINNP